MIATVPEFVKAKGPAPVVVTRPLNTKAAPFSEMPAIALVEIAPLNVEVPDPACCTTLLALIPSAVMMLALANVSVVKGVSPPSAPPREMLPAPAARVNA